MKILKENVGSLTNFEVLDFLRSRGAAKDPTGVLAPIAPSEFKVYNYLENTAAKSQTRNAISEFLSKCKQYKFTKTEIVSIINIVPSSAVKIYPILDNFESRFEEEDVEKMLELILQVFPCSEEEEEESETKVEESESKVEESESKVESEAEDEVNEVKEITG